LQQRVKAVTDGGLPGWLADLESPVFAKRDEAMRALGQMEFAAAPQLRKVVGSRASLEVVRRAEALLKALQEPTAPQHLQRWRAVTVLEQIATPAARQVLDGLARGEPAARLTRDARAALQRLAVAAR
jgi:hypothetical protein